MRAMMIEAALRALLLAAVVGLGLRVLQVRNVPARKMAWSGVLLASLAMPLLMRWPAAAGLRDLGWAVPVRVTHVAAPRATAAVVKEPTRDLGSARAAFAAQSRVAVDASASQPTQAVRPEQSGFKAEQNWRWPPLGRLIAMIDCGVSGALLLRLLWGLAVALRLWMRAEPVSPLIAPQPNVRSSASIGSPVTIGSGIVLPADYVDWDMRKLRMVLAHERAHVRGLDFYLQLLAGLYAAIFWFSPLGWWLRRALSTLGEAMGDRAGIDASASRSDYAQVVLEFAALPRRSLPGVAMACSGNLSRRVESMLNEGLFRRAFGEGRRRAMLAWLLVPAALFAATALVRGPTAQAAQSPVMVAQNIPPAAAPNTAAEPGTDAPKAEPDQAPAAPPADSGPQASPAPSPASAAAPVAAPTPPGEQTAPAAPPAPAEGPDEAPGFTSQDSAHVNGYGYEFSEDGDSWAVIQGPNENNLHFSGNGSSDVNAQIDKARSMTKGPFLWFTHDGKSYIIDDAAIAGRIKALYKPMEELGRQQAALGRQQAELGKQQEALGSLQEQASAKVPDMSAQMAEVNAALAKLQAAKGQMLTQQELAEVQEKVAQIQAKLGELQGEAGAKQGELGEQQGKLGAEQGKLGAQQGQLGAEQGRLAKEADLQVRSIIDQSLHNGTAKPVH